MNAQGIQQEHCFLWLRALEPVRRNQVPTHNCIEGANYYGCLNLRIEGIDPLFVGSGAVDLDNQGRMYQCFAQRDGQFILPGSSFKGALRAIVEALSPSCIAIIEGRDESRNYGNICRGDQTSLQLCPACGLLGAAGYRGRLNFSEGRASAGTPEVVTIPQRTSPRYCGPRGALNPCHSTFAWRKFYTKESQCRAPQQQEERIQVLKEAIFALEVGFQNLQEWELGLLVLGLGIAPDHKFNWKLGGAKNRHKGLVRVTLDPSNKSTYAQGQAWFFGQSANVTEDFLRQVTQAYLKQLDAWKVCPQVQENLQKLREEYGNG